MMIHHLFRMCANRSLAICALGFGLGCSTISCSTFERDYLEAAEVTLADDIQGVWVGTWQSSGEHGSGRLWCIVSKDDGFTYEFRYRAEWMKIFRGHYKVYKKVHREEETYSFEGEKDLGSFGSFRMSGQASPRLFNATYDSKFDKGTFLMERPPAKAAE